MTKEKFLEFIRECRANPPLQIGSHVEFSSVHFEAFANRNSASPVNYGECREMLRPFEAMGWIRYTEMLCWKITKRAPE